jgi:riboflavin kinase / FMN adenylyltransferase
MNAKAIPSHDGKGIIMRVFNAPDRFDSTLNPVLTMGTFDGVHRGHQAIIREVRAIAEAKNVQSALLTFDPHPREVIGHADKPSYLLTPIEERTEELSALGLDMCLILNFTRDISLLDAEFFFTSIILGLIKPCHIIVGADHAFGKGRRGNVAMLGELCRQHRIDMTIIEDLYLEHEKISSTRIRNALLLGDIEKANKMLGRPYAIHGFVQRGDGIGRELGFPTANINMKSDSKLLPKIGVYAARISVGSQVYNSIVNIGTRPTIVENGPIIIEAHLLGFDQNIYGMNLKMAIIARLRDEAIFNNVQDLARQIQRDKENAEKIFE